MTITRFPEVARHEAVVQALKAEVYSRCEGMPMATVLGIVDVLKMEIIREQT